MAKFNVNIYLIFIPTDHCYFNHYVDVLRIPKVISYIDKSVTLTKYLNLNKWIFPVDGHEHLLDFKY